MTWRGLLGAYSEQIKQREVKSQNKPCATLKTFSDYYSQDLNALVLLFKIPQTNIHKKGALKTACNKEKWKVEDYI